MRYVAIFVQHAQDPNHLIVDLVMTEDISVVMVDARYVMISVKHVLGPYPLIVKNARMEVNLTVAFAKSQKIMKF